MTFLPLYIDPGTGSMLLSLFIGIATAATFGIRALIIKLQFILSGGKVDKNESIKTVPYVIFSDHKRYWNVFNLICDEFEKRKIELVYLTASSDDPVFAQNYKYIKAEYLGEGNRPFAKLNSYCADILIATTPHLDVYQWKRSKKVKYYVHIPHTVEDTGSYRMFALDYYDAVLINGNNQQRFIRKIENVRPTINKKELYTVGSLPLDILKKRFDSSTRINNTVPVVLVAPSWGESGILAKYGRKLLNELSKSKFHVIVRPHPQTIVSEQHILKPLQEEFSNIEWNFDNDNFNVLNKADILITDFSGIIFDYSLVFDKPLIYADTKFDTSPYDVDWIEEKLWSLQVVEKIGIRLNEEEFYNIENIINDALKSHSLENARNEIRDDCWEYIGKSAERTVEWLINKRNEIINSDLK